MPNRMITNKIMRLTFVRKGRAMAKHPDTRSDAVEVVKSADLSPWYADFDEWLSSQDELGVDPLADFAGSTKESAKKNYPDSEGPFAGPHNSFPIRSAADVIHAAERLHNAKGNKASIKAKIRSIARAHGYPLPTTWGDKTEKSVDAKVLDLVNQLLAVVKAEEVETSAETPAETPAPEAPAVETPAPTETPAVEAPAETPAVETPAVETPEAEKESAKAMVGHDHNHSHVSTYGYQYSHSHQHGDAAHTDDEKHDMSETAHAHEHVEKAVDPETDANLKGLKTDLDAAKAEVLALKEKLSATETAKTAVEKAAARKPLVAATAGGTAVQKSVPQISSDMKYDDAFATLMGRSN